jgi:hypothetical protein
MPFLRRSSAPSSSLHQNALSQIPRSSSSSKKGGRTSSVTVSRSSSSRVTANNNKKKYVESDSGSSDEEDKGKPKKKKIQLGGGGGREPLAELTPHEQMIREVVVLKRPFKVPIPGYTGGCGGRTLGYRKDVGKRALHDETAPGALVLYSPEPPPVGVTIVSICVQ